MLKKCLLFAAFLSVAGCAQDASSDQDGNLDADVTSADAKADTAATAALTDKQALGKLLFEDRNLSASRTQSCASCHAAAGAFAGNNIPSDPLFPVAAGAFPGLFGGRNTPTAMYMAFSPRFGFAEEHEPGEETEFTPTGGQFWDGRADTLADQAKGPFLNSREMAMPNKAAVINRIKAAPYAALFTKVFGGRWRNNNDLAFDQVASAIEAFEKSSRFQPFTSKFDAVLRGQARFTAKEARGFAAFQDPNRGNCIGCHVGDVTSRQPDQWLFTDFTYDNLGVPRNAEIADNDVATYFDLGLCKQPSLAQKIPAGVANREEFLASLCGAFKVPTLRNVANTAPYMHNGFFTNLRDVVDFYVTRNTHPSKWYPVNDDGSVTIFDDLPAQYHGNVNSSEPPYDRQLGETPRLSPSQIDDVVAFLKTLSDGYTAR